VVLLDLMLPDGDGRDLCREIRASSDVPIVMLTARGEDVDRIVGLELGADDYVVKPFSARELVARIRAIMRRGRTRNEHTAIEVGDIRLDPAARTVTKRGKPVMLAAREFDLLAMLMANGGTVVRREAIMDEVWDAHWFGSTKTLDVHIAWLRRKLGDDPAHPVYITTIRGVGFRFAAPETAPSAEGDGQEEPMKVQTRLVAAFAYVTVTIIVALTIPLAISLDRSPHGGWAKSSATTEHVASAATRP
jgi:DNA-binding response OmpR family regulator